MQGSPVRLLTAKVQELHEVRGRLKPDEKAHLILSKTLLAAKKKVKTKDWLLQEASDLETGLTDATDLIAKLKATVSGIETALKNYEPRNLKRGQETTSIKRTTSPMRSPNTQDQSDAAPIYYTKP